MACAKMVGRMLKAICPSADKLESRRIGERDNEMDPVGLVYPSDKSIAAVVFPIAESLKQVLMIPHFLSFEIKLGESVVHRFAVFP